MRFATESEKPVVSVCLLSYNHEKYIKTAIESVLMQETDFPCELIIAEDCSTDSTRKIILSYAEKYPIKLILQEKNLGMQKNLRSLLNAPEGKYVAFFEGDDSWTDPMKLKKQFDILESNPNVAVCYANAKIFDTKNPASNVWFKEEKKPPVFQDCYSTVSAFTMPTCTVFFRNVLKSLPDWFLQARSCDYFMVALICKHGGAYYLDECLGLYNHHYAGLTRVTPADVWLIDDFFVWQNLYEYYGFDPKIYESVLSKSIANIEMLFYRGFPQKARFLFWKLDHKKILGIKNFRGAILRMGIKLHFPFFHAIRRIVKQ